MEHEYWEMFWSTGNVADYLSYKSVGDTETYGQEAKGNMGVGSGESDCTDRNGSIYSTGR